MQQDLNATRLLSQGGEERESSSLQNFPIRYPEYVRLLFEWKYERTNGWPINDR